MTRVRASRTVARPGALPRGETSQDPSRLAVPSSRNGDSAMNSLMWASSSASCFLTTSSLGADHPDEFLDGGHKVFESRDVHTMLLPDCDSRPGWPGEAEGRTAAHTPRIGTGALVFHLPLVKSGKSTGRLRSATDFSLAP